MLELFKTLEESLKTKKAVVIGSRDFDHKGSPRKSLKVRKANGKRVYYVTQYESGLYSTAA